MKVFILCLLVIVALFAGVNASSPHVLYTRNTAPEGWSVQGRARATEPVEFTVALTQRNLDQLNKIFEQLSDPKHEQYQNYMSIEQINDLVAPTKAVHDAVVSWFTKHGVHAANIKSFKDALDVKTTVAVAEKLFNTHMHTYVHTETGARVTRQFGSYSIPSTLRPHIEMITGLSSFPIPHLNVKRHRKVVGAPMDSVGIVAQTISSVYNLPAQTANASPQTSLAVIEFQGQNFSPADVATFGTQIGIPTTPVTAAHTVGPNDATNPQTEAELDIEITTTTNIEATNWFWLESGNGWLYQFATHFFSTQDVPQVNSISYGWYEGDQCSVTSECSSLGVDSYGYVNRVNTEFQKIGVRGITLISASGDSGANGRTDEQCTIPRLHPSFPGSSPYITAVGATQLNNPVFKLPSQPAACTSAGLQCPSGGDEVAVSFDVASFTSGGGFSDVAPTPSWQKDAVNYYLTKSGVDLPPASYFNGTSRGYPDVAAIGHNNLIVQSGAIQAVGGTSASAPIVASIIALLNKAAIAKSGKPLGFLNPFLYQAAAANPANFNDITVGDNICTESGCGAGCKGFKAAKGWDPVTGLGSLNYANLLNYIETSGLW